MKIPFQFPYQYLIRVSSVATQRFGLLRNRRNLRIPSPCPLPSDGRGDSAKSALSAVQSFGSLCLGVSAVFMQPRGNQTVVPPRQGSIYIGGISYPGRRFALPWAIILPSLQDLRRSHATKRKQFKASLPSPRRGKQQKIELNQS